MIQTIPQDKYKSLTLKELDVCGYKSWCYNYINGHNSEPVLDDNEVSVEINGACFRLRVSGREEVEKLKEAVDFALEL